MNHRIVTLAFGSFLALAGIGVAAAQPVPGHPRVNEIDQRLRNQEKRIEAGVAQGQIDGRQAARDTAVDQHVARQLSRDEARHNGHITAAEQQQMNRELNRNSARIHDQRH